LGSRQLTNIDNIVEIDFKHAWLSLEHRQRTSRGDGLIIRRSHSAAPPQSVQKCALALHRTEPPEASVSAACFEDTHTQSPNLPDKTE
jgi:hypothetical protein